MGNCCDCLNPKQDIVAPTAKTPLLSAATQPSSQAPVISPGLPARSARQHKPGQEKNELTSSLDALTTVSLSTISTVPSLDKTFQDHAKLYNDLYSTFIDLRKCLHDFKAKFEADTEGIPTIAECLRLLATRCGDTRLSGSMTKNCIQITYDKRNVSEKCLGPPEEVLETLELYNRANNFIKNILARAPQVQTSIRLILDEELKLKREVTKADPDGKLGPNPLRRTTENFSKLHKLPVYIDTIQKYTGRTFKEIANGSRILFENT
ncbi:unnamed protein product [Candidula unifasciata]|uniref:Uncharacterized protein n=1 Tax=Candidula unifasciata TaxID=100452 RepID=A0A8S3YQU8_9EUPU|nr:unnamed protein product [Candidula unifasciata]